MLTDRDYDLISDYLDGALTDTQRATVESRLANDPEFAAELEAIRRTVALVKGLPELVAPRDFTLSRQQAIDIDRELGRTPLAAPPRPRLLPRRFLPLVSAAASTLLVVVGALALFTGQARPPLPTYSSAVAMVTEDALTPTQTAAETNTALESELVEESALYEIEQTTTEAALEESEAPSVMMVVPEGTPTPAATQDMALRALPPQTATVSMTPVAQAGVPSTAPPPIAPSPLPSATDDDAPGGMGGGAMDSVPPQPSGERPTDIGMDDSGTDMTFTLEPLTAVADEPPVDAADSATGDLFSARMADETANAADAPSDAVPAPSEGISPLVALGMMAAGFVLGALTLWGWRRQR